MTRAFGTVIVCCLAMASFHRGNSQDLATADKILSAAEKLYQDSQYKKAADTLETAARIFESLNNKEGLIRALNLRGENIANLNQCDLAIEILNRSMTLAKEDLKGDHPELAQCYYYLARALGGCARRSEEGVAMMRQSINLKRRIHGEGVEIAFDYTSIGFMFDQTGQYDSAYHYLNKALVIRERDLPPDDPETSNTLYHLGRVSESRDDIAKALDFHQRAYRIRSAKLRAGHVNISNSLQYLGLVYQKMGNYDRALDNHSQALEIRKRSLGENHANVAGTYWAIGNLYASMFNYHQAISYLKRGNTIMENIYGEKSDIIPTYVAFLGSLYGKIGDHESALASFRKAQTMAEKNLRPDHPFLGIVYNFIGEYYADKDPSSKNVEYLRKAIPIFQKAYGPGSVREADVMARIGLTEAKNKNYEEALSWFRKAQQMFQAKGRTQTPKIATCFIEMADIAGKQGNTREALRYYQKAFSNVAAGFNDTTNLYANPALAAIDNKTLALKIVTAKAGVIIAEAGTSNKSAVLEHAMETYRLAIDLLNEIAAGYNMESARTDLQLQSRKIYARSMATAFDLYALTRDARYIKDAFSISERSKAAILLENLRDERAKMEAGVPDSLVALERDIKIELAWHQNNLRQAQLKNDSSKIAIHEKNVFESQQKHNVLKKNLERQFLSYFNLKYNALRPSVENIQRVLEPGTAVVTFFVEDSAIYRITLTKNRAAFDKVQRTKRFGTLVEEYEKSLTDASFILGNREKADLLYTHSAYSLYELLLKGSIEGHDEPVTRVIVIPDDFLAQFNFATLLFEPPASGSPDYLQLSYLARRCHISYAYATEFINPINALKSRRAKNRFAGFAPSYAGEQFAGMDTTTHPLVSVVVRNGNLPLPGAGEEVRVISQLMKGDSWLDHDASETNFKKYSGNYHILHLAMHSLLNNEHPQDSELIFNHERDTINDGYLNVSEIYNLKLNAALVVLSACSSGFGKIQKGEGPISISRAFSYAGCPSVVMSLWKIPDAVTGRIMTFFYEELKAGKPKDEALRTAQMRFLNENQDPVYQHPYFWAGFVVMGDTDPLPTRFPWWIVLTVSMLAIVIGAYAWHRRNAGKATIPSKQESVPLPLT